MPTASRRKAQSALSLAGISGVSGISVGKIKARGTVPGLGQSLRMMPDRAVSTRVSPMYAEKRDRDTSPDENLGRWIIGGVVVLALAAGAWFWLKRGSEAPEAPVAPPPVAQEPAIKNPIVAPDD